MKMEERDVSIGTKKIRPIESSTWLQADRKNIPTELKAAIFFIPSS